MEENPPLIGIARRDGKPEGTMVRIPAKGSGPSTQPPGGKPPGASGTEIPRTNEGLIANPVNTGIAAAGQAQPGEQTYCGAANTAVNSLLHSTWKWADVVDSDDDVDPSLLGKIATKEKSPLLGKILEVQPRGKVLPLPTAWEKKDHEILRSILDVAGVFKLKPLFEIPIDRGSSKLAGLITPDGLHDLALGKHSTPNELTDDMIVGQTFAHTYLLCENAFSLTAWRDESKNTFRAAARWVMRELLVSAAAALGESSNNFRRIYVQSGAYSDRVREAYKRTFGDHGVRLYETLSSLIRKIGERTFTSSIEDHEQKKLLKQELLRFAESSRTPVEQLISGAVPKIKKTKRKLVGRNWVDTVVYTPVWPSIKVDGNHMWSPSEAATVKLINRQIGESLRSPVDLQAPALSPQWCKRTIENVERLLTKARNLISPFVLEHTDRRNAALGGFSPALGSAQKKFEEDRKLVANYLAANSDVAERRFRSICWDVFKTETPTVETIHRIVSQSLAL